LAIIKRSSKEWSPPNAGKVKELWGECVDDMLEVRRNFWLNTSFFHGDQWVGWNDASASVELANFLDNNESKYRSTVNKFKPRVVSLQARLSRTPLTFEPRPDGVDAGALRKARIMRQVLQAKHHRDDWEWTRSENLQNVILGGVAAICVEPSWEFETEPTTDMQTGEPIYLPERPSIKLTPLTPVEFGIEPGSRSWRDARYWIRCTTLTPRQAKERYGLKEEPKPDADASASPMQRTLISNRNRGRQTTRACLVYVYYERPCEGTPGCVVHVVGGNVVEEAKWPFDFEDRLNIRPFVQTRMTGTWKGDTICNDARQIQKNINRAYTSINAHIGKADNARMLLPIGSVMEGEDELTGEVGEVIRYEPSSGGEPHWMNAPQVPRWLREHITSQEMELDDLFSTHAISRGEQVGDRNSGLALSILAEKDDTPLGLMSGDQQRGWQDIAEMVLMTERHLLEKMSEGAERPVEVEEVLPGQSHDDAPEEVRYRAEDIAEHPIVHIPLDAVMPKSQAAVQDMMLRFAQSFPQMFQTLGPSQLATILQVPDPFAFTYTGDPQVDLATWENGRMVAGADDFEVEIADWHDHDIHVQEHNRIRASASYRNAPPEVRKYIDLHIDAHAKLAAEQMAMQQQQMMMQQQVAPPQMEGEPPAERPPTAPAPQGVPFQ
jgi:hypothetical protein